MRLDVTSRNVEVFLFRNSQGTGYVEGDPANFHDPLGTIAISVSMTGETITSPQLSPPVAGVIAPNQTIAQMQDERSVEPTTASDVMLVPEILAEDEIGGTGFLLPSTGTSLEEGDDGTLIGTSIAALNVPKKSYTNGKISRPRDPLCDEINGTTGLIISGILLPTPPVVQVAWWLTQVGCLLLNAGAGQ